MFEKAEERVKWLKKGMDIVDIEELYLQTNGIKRVRNNVLMTCNVAGWGRVGAYGWIVQGCLFGECKNCKR